MDDLIDRDYAIDDLHSKSQLQIWDTEDVEVWVNSLPSAESEIIHCKNCKHRESNDCPMYYEEWIEIDEGDGYFDTDNIIHDWTTDEGFCHCAELRGDPE